MKYCENKYDRKKKITKIRRYVMIANETSIHRSLNEVQVDERYKRQPLVIVKYILKIERMKLKQNHKT